MTRSKLRPDRKPPAKAPLTIVDALKDPNLFQPYFGDLSTWRAWISFLKAVFGLEMDDEEFEIFKECTGRKHPPTRPYKEIALPVGRRAGKSFITALIATYMACFYDWRAYLGPGERATIMCMAADQEQARVIFRFISAFINECRLLRNLKEHGGRETQKAIDLRGQVSIEIHTSNFRLIRGYAIPVALLDEVAFWPTDDAQNPDYEILTALRPAMKQFGGSAMLFALSSPYARRGVLYRYWDNYFKQENDDVLVWQAPTWRMNPTISRESLESDFKMDYNKAKAEYGAEFRSDVESYISPEALNKIIAHEVWERRPQPDVGYFAFVDPSGGSRDSFTMAIAHEENNKPVLDVIREVTPPFSPEDVVNDFCSVMKEYGISECVGDRYAGEWPAERFRAHGVEYIACQKYKSELYRDLLPLVNSSEVTLLDNEKLYNQLLLLQRRTGRGRRDTIDHPPGEHDDVANAVAGVLDCVNNFATLEVW